MRKSVNFLEDAQVEPSKQIRMVARYTEGKAHTYYLNVIVDHEEEWSLEAYFRDIFDACFPSNFRESQRRRLYRFRQDTLTVKEYIAELTEIVDLVGDISPREQVVKLFKGLLFGVVVYLPRFRAGKISLTKPYGKNPYRRLYVQARVHIVRRIIAAELESRHLGGKRIMHDGGREIFVAKETSKWLVRESLLYLKRMFRSAVAAVRPVARTAGIASPRLVGYLKKLVSYRERKGLACVRRTSASFASNWAISRARAREGIS
ncbi:hypothetical protein PTI98_009211 [Pleurotus ostreatus]|nr:hypothetical protein PTI98_009211 [Pleurotus ostreatus]